MAASAICSLGNGELCRMCDLPLTGLAPIEAS